MNDELAFPGTEDKTTVAEVDAYIKGENCELLRKQNAELLAALQLIAGTDPIDAALDPQRAVRVARAAIKAAGGEA